MANPFINTGTDVGLSYQGTAPDLGWVETQIEIDPDPPEGMPVISAPEQDEQGVLTLPQLSYSSVTNATSYDIQIATDSSFQNLVVDENVGTISYTLQASDIVGADELSHNTAYYFRVRGVNVHGSSEWSDSVRFWIESEGAGYDGVLVQRGSYVLDGVASHVVTLSMPVPVGKAFALVSVRTADELIGRITAAILQTEVNGEYTELLLRRGSSGGSVTVEWEVISGDALAVQQGETTLDGVQSADETITEVSSNAFVVSATEWRSGTFSFTRHLVRSHLTSTTNLRLTRGFSSDSVHVVWYVVEWGGSTVQSGLISSGSSSTPTDTISTIDRSKSFLIFSYYGESTNVSERMYLRGRLSLDTEVEFRRGSASSDQVHISYYVITKDDLSAQYGDDEVTGTSLQKTINSVETDRAFNPVPSIGNGYVTDEVSNTAIGLNSRKLDSSTAMTIARGHSENSLFSSWTVVEDKTVGAAEIPDKVTASTPLDLATDVEVLTEFGWVATDHTNYYELQVSTNDTFTEIVRDVSFVLSNTYTLTDELDYNTEYYWRVRAVNEEGEGDWSDTNNFTTEVETAPGEGQDAEHPDYSFLLGSATIVNPVGNPYLNHGVYAKFRRFWGAFFDGEEVKLATKQIAEDGSVTLHTIFDLDADIQTGFQFGVTFDGDHLHFYRFTNTQIIYKRVTPNSDGSITQGDEHVLWEDSGWAPSNIYHSMTINTAGYPVMIARITNDSTGLRKPIAILSSTNNGTWTTATNYPFDLDAGSTDAQHARALNIFEIDSNKTLYSWQDKTDGDKMRARLNNNGTWEGAEDTGLAGHGWVAKLGAVDGRAILNSRNQIARRNLDGSWTNITPDPAPPIVNFNTWTVRDGRIYFWYHENE